MLPAAGRAGFRPSSALPDRGGVVDIANHRHRNHQEPPRVQLPLGRLEKVDLRSAWSHEAHSFTPWLAEESNLEFLGDALGTELVLVDTEKNVGPFSADILCQDAITGEYVLIENQLERTDHTHLGQLITYAAGLDAVTVVWVAAQFAEPHRAALDWLNEITSEGVNFFGLEIEVWRIGDSLAAPRLNLVAKPNEWTKEVIKRRDSAGELSETTQRLLDFWTGFADFVTNNSTLIKPRKPKAGTWMYFALGRSGVRLLASVSSKRETHEVGVYIARNADAFVMAFLEQRGEIEKEVGTELSVENPSDKKFAWIGTKIPGDLHNRDTWATQWVDLLAELERFHCAFSARFKAVKL